MKKIRVIIVDDSAYMRHAIREILNEDPEIEVVATASDPYDARDKIKVHNPDVMTLDVQMPRMDGISFLQKVMTLRPMPVVMLSSLTDKGAEITLQALELGAIDYITKPADNIEDNFFKLAREICTKVKFAAKAKIRGITSETTKNLVKNAENKYKNINPRKKIILIGSSTGGVEALGTILHALPKDCPGIVIVQHMPEKFTQSFAQRLNRTCSMNVVEIQGSMSIVPGTVYIAAGSHHIKFKKEGLTYCVYQDELEGNISGHKPSVDVMFESGCDVLKTYAAGFILTGMGRDGAKGMKKLFDNGIDTFGQSESSCVVYGMPKAAYDLGGVKEVVNLDNVADKIMDLCKN